MSSINGVNNSYNPATNLATGKRINNAANDAAGLAISETLKNQITGLDQATNNAEDFKNALNTADAGLSGMHDALNRIREIGVQASNGIYTDSDKAMMQEEVNGLLDEIKSAAQNTQFNTQKLLDGNFADKHAQTGANPQGMKISIDNTTLETLGLKDFDVTKNFDLSTIDNAIEMVSSARAKIGAQTNRLDHTIANNENTSLNLAESNSRIADADMAKDAANLKKATTLEEIRLLMQKQNMNSGTSAINKLF